MTVLAPMVAVGDQLALQDGLSALGVVVLIAGGVLLVAFALLAAPDGLDIAGWHRAVAVVLIVLVFVLLGMSLSNSKPRPEHTINVVERGDGTYMARTYDGDEVVYTVDADARTGTVTEVTHAALTLTGKIREMPAERAAIQLGGVGATVVGSTGDTLTVRLADGTERTFRVEYESDWHTKHPDHWFYYEMEDPS